MDKPNLHTLPVETLEGICSFIKNTGSLKSLRLVHREPWTKAQDVLAKWQFTRLKAHLAKQDLEKLLAISKHPLFIKTTKSTFWLHRFAG